VGSTVFARALRRSRSASRSGSGLAAMSAAGRGVALDGRPSAPATAAGGGEDRRAGIGDAEAGGAEDVRAASDGDALGGEDGRAGRGEGETGTTGECDDAGGDGGIARAPTTGNDSGAGGATDTRVPATAGEDGGSEAGERNEGRRRSRRAAALSMRALDRVSRRVNRSARPPTPCRAFGLNPMTLPSPRSSTWPELRTSSNRRTTPSARG
jgi:hypothetical protein